MTATESSTLWSRQTGPPLRLIVLLVALPLLAAIAFMAVEGWSFLDSLYMSVITLTTVGFMEIHELSDTGRVLLMVPLIVGLAVFPYGVVQIGEGLVAAQLRGLLGRAETDKAIRSLDRHLIDAQQR